MHVRFCRVDMGGIEAELKVIKDYLVELNRKLDELMEERELLSLMAASEKSLREFLLNEPDLYSLKDLKVRYR